MEVGPALGVRTIISAEESNVTGVKSSSQRMTTLASRNTLLRKVTVWRRSTVCLRTKPLKQKKNLSNLRSFHLKVSPSKWTLRNLWLKEQVTGFVHSAATWTSRSVKCVIDALLAGLKWASLWGTTRSSKFSSSLLRTWLLSTLLECTCLPSKSTQIWPSNTQVWTKCQDRPTIQRQCIRVVWVMSSCLNWRLKRFSHQSLNSR